MRHDAFAGRQRDLLLDTRKPKGPQRDLGPALQSGGQMSIRCAEINAPAKLAGISALMRGDFIDRRLCFGVCYQENVLQKWDAKQEDSLKFN